MNETLLTKWIILSKELVKVSQLIHGEPITNSENYTEEVIRLSYEPKASEWLCTCEIAIDLDCYETGQTPEEALQKAFSLLEEKLIQEKEKIQNGKYRLYGLEEN